MNRVGAMVLDASESKSRPTTGHCFGWRIRLGLVSLIPEMLGGIPLHFTSLALIPSFQKRFIDMRNFLAGGTVFMLALLTGCSQGTPGGPGASKTKTNEKPYFGQADDTFNLSVPLTSSPVQQGEEATTAIGIKRAKNFDQDVSLKFADIPKGVTIEPASPVIASGETEAKITFKAGDEAPLGEFNIQVMGHPAEGGDAQVTFKVTVVAKDTFTLDMPSSTTLKQGDKQTVLVGLKRDEAFDEDVALKFAELPKGVTLTPENPVIKQGSSEAQIAIAATKDASLGTFDVKVIGHPAKGADASGEFKLIVVKE